MDEKLVKNTQDQRCVKNMRGIYLQGGRRITGLRIDGLSHEKLFVHQNLRITAARHLNAKTSTDDDKLTNSQDAW
jgi:hypothetical protein